MSFNIEEGLLQAIQGCFKPFRAASSHSALLQAIQALYENSSSVVLLNSELWEFFKTTVSVHQGCLLSPILFNLFLETIMQKTLHDHHTSISIGARSICNLRFADSIDIIGGSKGKLKPHQQTRTQRKGICNGSQHSKQQGHDKQQKQ